METMRITSKYLPLLHASVFAGFLLLHDLSAMPIWSDEYFTYSVVFQGGFPSRVMADIHPPLYYILAIGFTHLIPGGLLALRLFSVLCAYTAICLSVILCRRYFGTTAAMILLILMPLNCHLVLFSRMARYYIPLTLFILIAQFAFDRMLCGKKPIDVALYILALTICFYTNLVSLLIIPAHLTLAALRKSGIKLSIFGQAISAILLLPWLPVVLAQISAKGGLAPFGNEVGLTPLGFAARIIWPLYDFSFGENIPPWDWMLSILPLLAVIGAIMWFVATATKRGELSALILWVLIPTAILTGKFLPVGIEFLPPRESFLLPFWLMAIAAGISKMPRRLMPVPIIILVAVSIVGNIRYFQGKDTFHSTYIIPWSEIAYEAEHMARPDGVIVSDDESIKFYLPRDARIYFLSTLTDAGDITRRHVPIVLVANPRDITPGGLLAPFLSALEKAGYTLYARQEFLKEDEKSRSVKQKLLRREVSRFKKEVRLYQWVRGAKE